MRSKEQTKDEMDRNEAIRTEAHRAWCDARERGETAPLDDLDHREGLARAWCEDHKREVKAGGLTIDQAAAELLAGRLYRVDTGSAGHDCIVYADSEDEALELVCEHAIPDMHADDVREKFDPWSAELVKI